MQILSSSTHSHPKNSIKSHIHEKPFTSFGSSHKSPRNGSKTARASHTPRPLSPKAQQVPIAESLEASASPEPGDFGKIEKSRNPRKRQSSCRGSRAPSTQPPLDRSLRARLSSLPTVGSSKSKVLPVAPSFLQSLEVPNRRSLVGPIGKTKFSTRGAWTHKKWPPEKALKRTLKASNPARSSAHP